jgi:ComF family protein
MFHYELPISYMITRLKFKHELIFANLFSALLCKKIADTYQGLNLPEVIIPVPLHPTRLRERGFNQALEIAKPISKKFNIAINHSTCVRRINTLPQSSLLSSERRHNVQHAFSLVKEISQKHIVLLDDVITTGHTINEIAQTFLKAGVEKIDVWCCAHTTSV